MKAQGRVSPSKPMSALGLIVGIVFVGIGVGIVIPQGGAFGVFWTLVAVAITGYHAVNLFSERGLAHEIVDIDGSASDSSHPAGGETPEQRLATLDDLKKRGIVTDDEYREQRNRILQEI
jgi:hypothetical protein